MGSSSRQERGDEDHGQSFDFQFAFGLVVILRRGSDMKGIYATYMIVFHPALFECAIHASERALSGSSVVCGRIALPTHPSSYV